MSPPSIDERRAHPRLAVFAGVSFYHPASKRELPGRTANLSRGGLWMYVPPYAPLLAGQEIQILDLPELEDTPSPGTDPGATGHFDSDRGEASPGCASHARPLPATVIRVDRASLPTTGQVGVAVRFHKPLDEKARPAIR